MLDESIHQGNHLGASPTNAGELETQVAKVGGLLERGGQDCASSQ